MLTNEIIPDKCSFRVRSPSFLDTLKVLDGGDFVQLKNMRVTNTER